MGQASELEAQLAGHEAALLETNRVGWHLLHFIRDSLTSLEEQATRVLAGQIAGFIAIWTQLHTFDRGLPRLEPMQRERLDPEDRASTMATHS